MSILDTYLWAISLYANWWTAVSLVLVLVVGPAVVVLIGGRKSRSAPRGRDLRPPG